MPSERSPYAYYLDLLGKCPTAIALASQWFVLIDFRGVNSLLGNLQYVLGDRESKSDWQYDQSVTKYLLDGSLQSSTGNLMGCAFARSVRLPGETVDAGHQGLDYGGFQAPATSNGRKSYEKLEITMIETNTSFLDLVLRPWTVMTGYNGLIARAPSSEKYVKSNFIKVYMMAKTGAYSNMAIRKEYTFNNVAPVRIPSEEYSYSEEGLRVSTVEFVYDNYFVSDASSSNLISLD
jgi:hypothetical protein